MGSRRSRRLAAWDFAWSHIEAIAGFGDLELSEAQVALRRQLERLYEMPIPAQAIETLGLALYEAWRIGRESKSGV